MCGSSAIGERVREGGGGQVVVVAVVTVAVVVVVVVTFELRMVGFWVGLNIF